MVTDSVDDACMEIVGLPGDTVVATINGEDLLLSEVAYWLSYDSNMLGYYYYGGVENISWDDNYTDDQTVSDFVKEDALTIAQNYLVIAQKAAELGLTLSDEETASVDETMQSYVDSFGETLWDSAVEDGTVVEDDFDDDQKAAWIQENGTADMANEVAIYGTTVDYLRYMAEIYQLYTDVQENYFSDVSDDELAQYVEDNSYYAARSILFMNLTDDDGNTVAFADMDDDQKNELKAEAQAALDDILSSDDPETTFSQYQAERSDDTGSNSEGAYYVFADGDMVDEYTESIAALGIGEMGTQLVESENYGYFIVQRLELSYDDVPVTYSSYSYTIRDLYIQDAFDALISQWNDEAVVETTEAYDNMDMADFAAGLVELTDRLYPSEEETEETESAETETAETETAE